jgi:hypothetical protein
MPDDALLNRIRCEFIEMPGLRLTRPQAQRLYGLDEALCQRALDRLVDTRFLCIKPNGTYGRLSDCLDSARPNLARADLSARERSVKVPA